MKPFDLLDITDETTGAIIRYSVPRTAIQPFMREREEIKDGWEIVTTYREDGSFGVGVKEDPKDKSRAIRIFENKDTKKAEVVLFEDGRVKSYTEYADGKKDGLHREYHDTEERKVKVKGQYWQDNEIGDWVHLHRNGRVKFQGVFDSDGEPVGFQETFYDNGCPRKEVVCSGVDGYLPQILLWDRENRLVYRDTPRLFYEMKEVNGVSATLLYKSEDKWFPDGDMKAMTGWEYAEGFLWALRDKARIRPYVRKKILDEYTWGTISSEPLFVRPLGSVLDRVYGLDLIFETVARWTLWLDKRAEEEYGKPVRRPNESEEQMLERIRPLASSFFLSSMMMTLNHLCFDASHTGDVKLDLDAFVLEEPEIIIGYIAEAYGRKKAEVKNHQEGLYQLDEPGRPNASFEVWVKNNPEPYERLCDLALHLEKSAGRL